jgi:hypothetical protein
VGTGQRALSLPVEWVCANVHGGRTSSPTVVEHKDPSTQPRGTVIVLSSGGTGMPATSAQIETVSVPPEADSQQYDPSTPVTLCLLKWRTPSGGLEVLEGVSLVIVGFGDSGSVGASLTSRAHPVEVIPTATTSTVAVRKCVLVRTSMLLTGYQEDTPPLLRLPRQTVS